MPIIKPKIKPIKISVNLGCILSQLPDLITSVLIVFSIEERGGKLFIII